jgi:hypothetical protein
MARISISEIDFFRGSIANGDLAREKSTRRNGRDHFRRRKCWLPSSGGGEFTGLAAAARRNRGYIML